MNGFTYMVTKEQIEVHRKRSLVEKLQLIEDMIEFNYRFASPQAKKIQQALRAGNDITTITSSNQPA